MKADRYSNTGKYYRTDKKRKNGGIRRTAAAVLALTLAFSAPASAAGWEQEEETWYYLDDDGVRQTGWVQTENGRWYELDETGAWIEHPALTDETAGYLLSNALMDAGWYQNEGRELEFARWLWVMRQSRRCSGLSIPSASTGRRERRSLLWEMWFSA